MAESSLAPTIAGGILTLSAVWTLIVHVAISATAIAFQRFIGQIVHGQVFAPPQVGEVAAEFPGQPAARSTDTASGCRAEPTWSLLRRLQALDEGEEDAVALGRVG